MPRKKTKEEVIEAFRKVHGDKYDYTQVTYVDAHTKVKIICQDHGMFEQAPSSHLGKSGCPDCGISKRSKSQRKTREEIIKNFRSVHGDKYVYSLVSYININTKVKIVCQEHGVFEQMPSNHLSGNGCPVCSGNTAYDK